MRSIEKSNDQSGIEPAEFVFLLRMMKKMSLRWAGHVVDLEEKRKIYVQCGQTLCEFEIVRHKNVLINSQFMLKV
jgi:hypothetical protein